MGAAQVAVNPLDLSHWPSHWREGPIDGAG